MHRTLFLELPFYRLSITVCIHISVSLMFFSHLKTISCRTKSLSSPLTKGNSIPYNFFFFSKHISCFPVVYWNVSPVVFSSFQLHIQIRILCSSKSQLPVNVSVSCFVWEWPSQLFCKLPPSNPVQHNSQNFQATKYPERSFLSRHS